MSNFYLSLLNIFSHITGWWKPDYINDYYSDDEEEAFDLIENILHTEEPKKKFQKLIIDYYSK